MNSYTLGAIGGITAGIIAPGSAFAWKAAWSGFQIGMTVGGIIDASRVQRAESGKLDDLKLSGSSYGAPIPIIWGRHEVGSTIIWAAQDGAGNHLFPHRRTVGRSKKGGGSSVVYYKASFAALFCAGALYFPEEDATRNLSASLVSLKLNERQVYKAGSASNLINPTWHSGAMAQAPDSSIVASLGVASGNAPAYPGSAYCVIQDLDLSDYGGGLPAVAAIVDTGAVTLDTILSDLFRMCGLKSTEFDVTAAAGINVPGFKLVARGEPRSAIDELLLAFGFGLIERGKIYVVPRFPATSFSIPYDHLRSEGDAGPITRVFPDARELSGAFFLEHFDSGSLESQVTAAFRPSTGSFDSTTFQTNLALTPTEAETFVGRIADEQHTESTELRLATLFRHIGVAPGDVGTVETSPGVWERVRVSSQVLDPIGLIKMVLRTEGEGIETQATTGSAGGTTLPPAVVIPASFDAWSGRELISSHEESAGFYVVAAGTAIAWPGGVIYYSSDAGVSWVEGPAIRTSGTFGATTSVLSGSGAVADTLDTANTIGVSIVGSSGELGTTTDSAVELGDNRALVGSEILGFGVATLTGTGLYTLSRLLRGLRGTPVGGHANPERFVEISDDIVRVGVPDSLVGSTLQVRVVSIGQAITDVTSKNVVIAAKTPGEIESVKASTTFPVYVANSTLATDTAEETTWTTIDLSGSLPAETKTIRGFVRLRNNGSVVTNVRVRKAAGAAEYTIFALKADSDLDENGSQFEIPMTPGRTFQYVVEGTDCVFWELVLQGYTRTIA